MHLFEGVLNDFYSVFLIEICLFFQIMTALVFGTGGVGTFILLTIWSAALVLCFISLRTHRNVGPVAVFIALLVMVVLLLIPRGTDTQTSVVDKVHF